MKNIHLLPTEKPSRLFKFANELHLDTIPKDYYKKYNIYITSDEEIKEGDWVVKISSLYKGGGNVQKYSFIDSQFEDITFKKIILTTDQDLIADSVQGIDDEFLEWFIKNPSCESIEVEKRYSDFTVDPFVGYKIIIPQEEPKHSKVFSENGNQLLFDKQGNLIKEEHNPFELPEVLPDVMFYESLQETKQETLEEVLRKYPLINQRIGFKNGAKTFEENMIEIMDSYADDVMGGSTLRAKEWFEKFKKK